VAHRLAIGVGNMALMDEIWLLGDAAKPLPAVADDGSTICSTFAAATSPLVSIELQGGVRLRCGPTSAGLLPRFERRALLAPSRLSDDNLTMMIYP
jgi:hypothetical protein